VTLYFWDASDFDWPRGPMDLGAAHRDGITGFTYKASEGTSFRHVHTGEALARARDAGFEFIGAYHVVRTANINAQVNNFLNYLDQCAPWWRNFPGWVHQIDLELWSYDAVSAATGIAFAKALVAAQDKFVVMYASRGQYGNQLTGCSVPLWNAAYGTNPAVHYPDAYRGDSSGNWNPYSGQTPVFWQYGSTLRIGTQLTCDCSAYRGTLADLRALVIGTSEEGAMKQVLVRFGDAPSTDGGVTPGYMRVFLADGQRLRELPSSFFELPAGGLLRPKAGIIGNDGTHIDNMLGNLGNNGEIFLADPGWANHEAWGKLDAPITTVSPSSFNVSLVGPVSGTVTGGLTGSANLTGTAVPA